MRSFNNCSGRCSRFAQSRKRPRSAAQRPARQRCPRFRCPRGPGGGVAGPFFLRLSGPLLPLLIRLPGPETPGKGRYAPSASAQNHHRKQIRGGKRGGRAHATGGRRRSRGRRNHPSPKSPRSPKRVKGIQTSQRGHPESQMNMNSVFKYVFQLFSPGNIRSFNMNCIPT